MKKTFVVFVLISGLLFSCQSKEVPKEETSTQTTRESVQQPVEEKVEESKKAAEEAVQQTETKEEEIMTLKGIITFINADDGYILVKHESGQVVTLTGVSKKDLEPFSIGDQVVIVKSGSEGVIKSITKQE